MRLVCPNCSAQYEIDGSMIPDEGRDVQCSNCGHTWFELPPAGGDFDEMGREDFASPVAESADEDELSAPEPDTSDAQVEARDEALPEPEPGDDGSEPDFDEEADEDLSDAAQAVSAAAAAASSDEDDDAETGEEVEKTTLTPRRPADAAALDILREEAERELSQRRAPPSESLETQTDLGLEEVRNRNTPSRALRARMAHLGEEDSAAQEPETPEAESPSRPDMESQESDDYTEPRRDLLPDIDEINSTLSSARRRSRPGPEETAANRSGFRAGFILVLLVVVAMIFAYAQAPAIARALPETEPALLSFVDHANGLRDWVDGLLGGK